MGAEFVLPEAEPSARVDTATVDGGRCLSIRGEASAGVDLDENERARGDLVRIEFRFRVEAGDRHVLCTVGDARDPARLVIEGLTASLVSARTTVVLGSVRRGKWTAVSLQTSGDRTAARLADGAYSAVDHQPQATWLYLGQGYRTGAVPGTSVLLIDVESVRTQVLRQE
jgi:hypothetical protein